MAFRGPPDIGKGVGVNLDLSETGPYTLTIRCSGDTRQFVGDLQPASRILNHLIDRGEPFECDLRRDGLPMANALRDEDKEDLRK